MIKKKARFYSFFDENGKERFKKVEYTLVYKNGILSKVFNEHSCSIMEDSECFEYFKEKYGSL